MKSEKYNEENTKKVQELSKRMEEEFARREAAMKEIMRTVIRTNGEQERKLDEIISSDGKKTFESVSKELEKKIVRSVFVLLIERAQSVIAAGYEGLGVQDLKDLAFNEYGIDLEENQ